MKPCAASRLRLLFALGLICAVLLLLNGMRYYARIDFSRNKIHTPVPFTTNLLRSVPEPLSITYYLSSDLKPLYPSVNAVSDFLYDYAAANKSISVRVANPISDELQASLASLGIQSQQIQTTSGRQTGFINVYSAIVLEYGGKTAVIPFILSVASLEYDLNVRVQSLVLGIERSCLILAANGFDLRSDYPYLIPWLNAAGFSCTEVTSADLIDYAPSVPLILLGSSQLSMNEALAVENRIRSGGRVIFAVSSTDVRIYDDWNALPVTNTPIYRLIEHWGVSVRPEMLLDVSNFRITMTSAEQQNQFEYINYPFWVTILPQFVEPSHPLSVGFTGLQLFWPSPLVLSGTGESAPKPVIYSSPGARLMPPADNPSQPFITDPFFQYFLPENSALFLPKKSPEDSVLAASLEGSLPLLYGGGLSLPTRILVIGDQYFCSKMIEYTNSPGNIDFLVSALLWTAGDDEMLEIRARGITYTELTKITDTREFERVKKITLFFTLGLIPLTFVLAGSIVLFKRRKK